MSHAIPKILAVAALTWMTTGCSVYVKTEVCIPETQICTVTKRTDWFWGNLLGTGLAIATIAGIVSLMPRYPKKSDHP